eukprot:7601252-Alexandrium_andersonii.AAC.1
MASGPIPTSQARRAVSPGTLASSVVARFSAATSTRPLVRRSAPRGLGCPSARPAGAVRHGRLQEALPRAHGPTVSDVPTRACARGHVAD